MVLLATERSRVNRILPPFGGPLLYTLAPSLLRWVGSLNRLALSGVNGYLVAKVSNIIYQISPAAAHPISPIKLDIRNLILGPILVCILTTVCWRAYKYWGQREKVYVFLACCGRGG